MNTQIIAQPAYIDNALNELALQFPEWCSVFEHQVRIQRAEQIAKQGGIERIGEQRFTVPSSRTDNEPYIVDRSVGTCTCPDYRKNLFHTSPTGWKCKHRIAVYLTLRAFEMEAADILAQRELELANEKAQVKSGLDTYADILDQLPDAPAEPAKPKRKPRSRKAATTVIAEPAAVTASGTWDLSITGEIVHVCADGFNSAPIMGINSELWCHRCNEPMPHTLMTRESRLVYNHVSHIADNDTEAQS